jgi:hypothetical protein
MLLRWVVASKEVGGGAPNRTEGLASNRSAVATPPGLETSSFMASNSRVRGRFLTGGGRLVANRANENGDFGIEAIPGVQAHGNHAFGNGNPLQCLDVKCN